MNSARVDAGQAGIVLVTLLLLVLQLQMDCRTAPLLA
jgi:hypothetical protein